MGIVSEKVARRQAKILRHKEAIVKENMLTRAASHKLLQTPSSICHRPDCLKIRFYKNTERLLSPADYDTIIAKHVGKKKKEHPIVTLKRDLEERGLMAHNAPWHIAPYVYKDQVRAKVPDRILAMLQDESMTLSQYYDEVAKFGAVWGLDQAAMHNGNHMHTHFRFPQIRPLSAMITYF